MAAVWDRMRSQLAGRQRLLIRAGGGAIALITAALLGQLAYQSSITSFARYQAYQDNILALRELETTFNQEILKSRYELFASYDTIVQNLANQDAIQRHLNDIPGFIGGQDRREVERILNERQVALEQKDNLSEWFKSRNALLKNSLRYLPFLTEQLETTFAAASGSPLVSPSGSSAPASSAPAAPAAPVTPSTAPPATSPAAPPPAAPPTANLNTLTSTLNQLIRNLLLYNASADEALAEQTQALVTRIAQLENTLEIGNGDVPIEVFRSHANVILTTKPLVEELTGQLILPLSQYTDSLEATTRQAYQRASRLTTLYRTLTILWILLLVGLANLLLFRRFRYQDPAFQQYQEQVKTLASAAAQLHPDRPDDQDDLKLDLAPLLTQDNAIGQLASSLEQWRKQLATSAPLETLEAFTFLAARLSFLTKNRRKLIGTDAAHILEETCEATLRQQNCHLIDIQFEADQVIVRFTYPETMQLSQLCTSLQKTTAKAIYSMVQDRDETLTSPAEMWSDAYLIASCETPTQQDTKQKRVPANFVHKSVHNGQGEGV